MPDGKIGTWSVLVRTLCVIALFAVGFAHRVPAAASVLSAAEIAALTLPDGTLPELCLPGTDHDDKGHTVIKDCEACRISSVALLPQPADASGIVIRASVAVALPRSFEAFQRQLFPPNAAPRAPPAPAYV